MSDEVRMSERIEYGRRIDCALNGCTEPHGDDGLVMEYGDRVWAMYEKEGIKPGDRITVNNHAAVVVQRTVTYGEWQ